jgi:hypothetical protein
MQNYKHVNANVLILSQALEIVVSWTIKRSATTTKTALTKRITRTRNLLSLAKEMELSQPNLTAEFRNFIARS